MTAQIHEKLILDGKETSMAFCPPLPKNHTRIAELKDEEIEKDGIIFSTACWREYIGIWEIRDKKFFLVKLKGRYKLLGSRPVFAEWFTGTLRIPEGKRLQYVHMGYGSVFERELHIKIEKGEVTRSQVIDNRKKEFNEGELGWKNLPGFENRFDGDDEL